MDQNIQPESIEADEKLFRRISYSYYKEHKKDGQAKPPPIFGFKPTPRDTTGLSVFRKNITTPDAVAAGKHSYIAVLDGGTMLKNELHVKPTNHLPGHAEITDLTWSFYESNKLRAIEIMTLLASDKVCLDVLGPFNSPLSDGT